ncbi:hypothetical protein C0Q70_04549 [Pomacea canaliculata]|uniref:ADAM cysteine-rich domain-containing protein n=1 Tax=Pomacea canaliculata TaxID=400727 RepID=A0A2T7PIP0_POMCA|nr:hypothetical protein C0Q70_04549 [Pomacea canaliculata]
MKRDSDGGVARHVTWSSLVTSVLSTPVLPVVPFIQGHGQSLLVAGDVHVACSRGDVHVACNKSDAHVACSRGDVHVACNKSDAHVACSRGDVHVACSRRGQQCLYNNLTSSNIPDVSGQQPGQVYDHDAQCRQTYGPSSVMCRGIEFYNKSADICTTMFCNDGTTGNRCAAAIAARGTSCGNKKWCVNGQCVYDIQAPSLDGNCKVLPQNCGRSTAPAATTLARTHAQSNTRAFTDPHIHVSTKDSYTNSQSRESHTAADGGHFYLQITAPLETNQAWCSTTRPAHKWFPVTLVTATKMSSSAGVADRVPTTTLACKTQMAACLFLRLLE